MRIVSYAQPRWRISRPRFPQIFAVTRWKIAILYSLMNRPTRGYPCAHLPAMRLTNSTQLRLQPRLITFQRQLDVH